MQMHREMKGVKMQYAERYVYYVVYDDFGSCECELLQSSTKELQMLVLHYV